MEHCGDRPAVKVTSRIRVHHASPPRAVHAWPRAAHSPVTLTAQPRQLRNYCGGLLTGLCAAGAASPPGATRPSGVYYQTSLMSLTKRRLPPSKASSFIGRIYTHTRLPRELRPKCKRNLSSSFGMNTSLTKTSRTLTSSLECPEPSNGKER